MLRRISLCVIAISIALAAGSRRGAGCNIVNKAVAVLVGQDVSGVVYFEQQNPTSPVRVQGIISGLSPGLHGFHVHQYGDRTQGCASTAGHFNPFQNDHGAPDDQIRHVGDLGNIEADQNGEAQFDFFDNIISLNGPLSIVGRGVVVHANVDDLGRGGHEQSKTTGNAGGRLACGVIGITS